MGVGAVRKKYAAFRARRMRCKTREVWKGHPIYSEYEFSKLGHVRHVNGESVKQILNGRYDMAHLPCIGRKRLHICILETFVGPRPAGMWGCHHDDNQRNNRLSNLAWKTPKENAADATANGYVRIPPPARKWTSEEKSKRRAAMSSNNHFKGKHHTEEFKASMRNRLISDETRQKMSIARKRRIITDETKAKISAAGVGRKFSPESIAKRVESIRITKERNRLAKGMLHLDRPE